MASQLPKFEPRDEPLTTASFGLWPWAELTRRNQLPIERLCEAAGIEISQLRDPAERLTQASCNGAAAFAYEHFGTGAAMAAALTVEAGHFQLIELLARTAPTVGDGLRLGCWFFPLLHAGGRLEHETAPDGSHAVNWHPPTGYAVHPGYVELTFGVSALGIRRETRRPELMPTEVWFRHAAPTDTTLHASVLGPDVQFEMPEDRMVFDRRAAALPLARRNADVHKKAVRAAQDMIGKRRRP